MTNDKKPVYLLAGGRPRNSQTLAPLLTAVFRESGKTSPAIAYIGTANGDDSGFFNRMAEAFGEAGACKVTHARISSGKANLKKAGDILTSADIVFLSGGDVEVGMTALRENGMVGLLTGLFEQGKLFFGISAGAIMLAQKWVRWRDPDDESSAELFPCLGFAPVICDCHDEQAGWEELKVALKLEKDNVQGYGLVAGSAVRVFRDGKIEALGTAVHRYVRNGSRVERLPDIQPVSGGRASDDEQNELLSRRICDLSLRIEGTPLESSIRELYQNLEKAGITFKPGTYLTDEWGCPNGVPVIGIPFYLADPALSRLHGRLTGFEAEEEADFIRYLRHEAGHAFNYAHRLHAETEWQRLFGQFSQPYDDVYRPVPFSADFVRHMPGWYAEKHPDEDFAETFAVWLTPDLDWRKRYDGTPALAKLLLVDSLAGRYGRKPPVVTGGELDAPIQELTMTLGEWYRTYRSTGPAGLGMHPALNNDLRKLFPAGEGEPAAAVLKVNRARLIQEVNNWTGMNRRLLAASFDELVERTNSLGLKIDPEQVNPQLVRVSVFLTTLAMNYIYRGEFVDA